MTQRVPPRILLATVLATLLFAGGLRDFLASVYYHNLTSLGLNATALFALALLSPLLYHAPRLLARPHPVALVAALVLGLARAAAPFTTGVPHLALAGLSAAAFMVLLPALLRLSRGQAGDEGPAALAAGLGLGWAFDAALHASFLGDDPTRHPLAALPILLAAGVLAWLLFRGRDADPWPGRDALPARWRLALAGLGFGALFFLQNAVLGAPDAVAQWGPHPRWLAVAGILPGLVAGALLLRSPRRPLLTLVLAGIGLLGLLDHGFLHTPVAPLLLGVAQAALVLLAAPLAALLSRATLRGAGGALAWGALAALLLHFAYAFAFTFAYVPLGEVWRGSERVLPTLAFLLVLGGGLAAGADLHRPSLPRAFPVRPAAALAVLALLAPAVALAVPPEPVAAPEPGEPVRVLAFNVHQGFRNAATLDPDLFVEVLRQLDADVVALQESDTGRFTSGNMDVVTLLARRLGYHAHHGPATHEQSVGLALLSRFPIREASVHALPSTTDNRFYLEARLDAHGRDLWVYVVHLGLPAEDRVAQADLLLARAATRSPRILAGDFNSCPAGLCPEYEGAPDDVYERVLRAGHRDAWTDSGGARDDPAAFTYEAARPFERIDYVFVGEGLRVTRAETIRASTALAASDHLPVLASVQLG